MDVSEVFLPYHGFGEGRLGADFELLFVFLDGLFEFKLPLALAFSCCFLSISSACFLPSLIRWLPSLALRGHR